MSTSPYAPDLACIHDAGHGDVARHAATAMLDALRQRGMSGGRIVDLGCGSGIAAEQWCAAGYDVLGIDLSPAMIDLARRRAPRAEFRVGSFLDVEIPPCVAVTAIGECFSYLFDSARTDRRLDRLFVRVYESLPPGGLFLFDVVTPGRVPGGGPRQLHRVGDDWAVLVTAEEDRNRRLLTRHITSFRKVGDSYRRDSEVHRQRLFDPRELTARLRRVGFRVRRLRGYREFRFPRGVAGFLARKR
jgi:SAM-dependent methyltransferase